MSTLKYTLFILALFITGSTVTRAQSYTYTDVRKDYVFDDGFGIPHSKIVKQDGYVQVDRTEVCIDGIKYRMDSEGVYKNAKGKSVDLSYTYNGTKLVAVSISIGHIVNNYLVNQPDLPGRPTESQSATAFTQVKAKE